MAEIKLYTLKEVQGVLKVTQRSLYNYIKAGELKAVKLGREWRVSEDALKEFSEKGTSEAYLQKLRAK